MKLRFIRCAFWAVVESTLVWEIGAAEQRAEWTQRRESTTIRRLGLGKPHYKNYKKRLVKLICPNSLSSIFKIGLTKMQFVWSVFLSGKTKVKYQKVSQEHKNFEAPFTFVVLLQSMSMFNFFNGSCLYSEVKHHEILTVKLFWLFYMTSTLAFNLTLVVIAQDILLLIKTHPLSNVGGKLPGINGLLRPRVPMCTNAYQHVPVRTNVYQCVPMCKWFIVPKTSPTSPPLKIPKLAALSL